LSMEINVFIGYLAEEFEDLGVFELTPNTILKNIPGWNSMHILLLVSMIDYRYGVLLSGEHLKHVITVNDLFELVKEKQGEH
jgi:acyl carrier protein